jgi:hypothetical protein
MFPLADNGLEFFRVDTVQRDYTDFSGNPALILSNDQYSEFLKGFLRPLKAKLEENPKSKMDFLIGFVTDTTRGRVHPATVTGACPDPPAPPANPRNPPCLAGGIADALWGIGDNEFLNAGVGVVAAVTDNGLEDAIFGDDAHSQFSAGTTAHELAHLMGLRHVTAKTVGRGNVLVAGSNGCDNNSAIESCPNWPYTDPTIQFTGFDITTLKKLDGTQFYDFMSYCFNANQSNMWISPFSYRTLFDNNLAPSNSPYQPWNACQATPGPLPNVVNRRAGGPSPRLGSPSAPTTPQDYLIVTGTAQSDGNAGTLVPAFHVSTVSQPTPSYPNGNYCLQFSDPTGASLGNYCFTLTFVNSETGDAMASEGFSYLVQLPAGTAGMALVNNGNTLATVSAGAQPPTVAMTSPNQGDTWTGGMQTISWTGTTSGTGQIVYSLDYSTDGGNTWQPIAMRTAATQFSVDPSTLSGGNNVFFQVIASDGLNNASATVGPITISQSPTASALPPNFPNALANTAVTAQVQLTNGGNGPLLVTNIVADPPFSHVSPAFPLTVGAASSLTLNLKFTPPSTGPYMGNLTITSNASDNPVLRIPLTGYGISTATSNIYTTPANLDFGAVTYGTPVTKNLTVKNGGPAPVNVSSVSASGTGYSIPTPPGAFGLGAGGSQVVPVQFTPTQNGSQPGGITIVSDDDNNPTLVVKLTANVTGGPASPASISVPSSLALGTTAPGQAITKTLTVSNNGTGPLNVTALTLGAPQIGGVAVNETSFSVTPAAPFTVAPKGTATLTVKFQTRFIGLQTDILTIVSNDPMIPSVTVALTATGSSPSGNPAIAVTPTVINFGNVQTASGRDVVVNVADLGIGDLVVERITFTGPYSNANASVLSGPGTPFVVHSGSIAALPVTINFAPVSLGAQTGSATFYSNDPANPAVTINFTGTGVALAKPAQISLNPPNLNFGAIAPGKTQTLSLTMTNTGDVDFTVARMLTSGAFSVISPNQFPITVVPPTVMPYGVPVTITVQYAPTATGGSQQNTGLLTIVDPVSHVLATVNLTAAAVAPVIAVTPSPQTPLVFGNVTVNTTSPPQTVTITNQGNANLNVLKITPPAGYTVTPAAPLPPIAPLGQAILTVTLSPTTATSYNGEIIITSDDPVNSPSTVYVTGMGVAGTSGGSPQVSAPANLTISQGGTSPLTLTNSGTASASVTLTTAAPFGLATTSAGPPNTTLPITVPVGSTVVYVFFNPPSSTTTNQPGQVHIAVGGVDNGSPVNLTGTVTPASTTGTLTVTSDTSNALHDLTTEGQLDWVHYGDQQFNSPTTPQEHKLVESSSGLITTQYTYNNSVLQQYTNDPRPLSWTDGNAPTASSSGSKTGLFTYSGVGTGFAISAPSDPTTVRTLIVHVGGYFSSGQLVVSLSDGSHQSITLTTPTTNGQWDRNYFINYQGPTAGATVNVVWTLVSGGNITLCGAALTPGTVTQGAIGSDRR